MKVDLSKYNNGWYRPGAAWKRAAWYLVSGIFFKTGLFPFYGLKTFFLRAFGASVGKSLVIKPFVSVKYPWLLTIGDHCWLGEQVWIDNLAPVSIGNNVCISQGALLLCGNHDYTKETFDLSVQPISLEDGVWIGARALVCPGTLCKTHSVLSVQSVASGTLEAYTIYQGNPAVSIKSRVMV
ncbi:MAG: colanic acid biosynthesis acetyltransferase WcaF [Rhizobacter sp.]|nr:colanic acid biosynthesis acetyltransferase WcaF [Ferruginibacter sp.]